MDYYNLDVIISAGYRVKSLRTAQFRIWATNILKLLKHFERIHATLTVMRHNGKMGTEPHTPERSVGEDEDEASHRHRWI